MSSSVFLTANDLKSCMLIRDNSCGIQADARDRDRKARAEERDKRRQEQEKMLEEARKQREKEREERERQRQGPPPRVSNF